MDLLIILETLLVLLYLPPFFFFFPPTATPNTAFVVVHLHHFWVRSHVSHLKPLIVWVQCSQSCCFCFLHSSMVFFWLGLDLCQTMKVCSEKFPMCLLSLFFWLKMWFCECFLWGFCSFSTWSFQKSNFWRSMEKAFWLGCLWWQSLQMVWCFLLRISEWGDYNLVRYTALPYLWLECIYPWIC